MAFEDYWKEDEDFDEERAIEDGYNCESCRYQDSGYCFCIDGVCERIFDPENFVCTDWRERE